MWRRVSNRVVFCYISFVKSQCTSFRKTSTVQKRLHQCISDFKCLILKVFNIIYSKTFLTRSFWVISIWTSNLHSCVIAQFLAFSCFEVFYLNFNRTKSWCATCFIFWHTKCQSFVIRWLKSHDNTITTFWAIEIQSIAAKDGTPCIWYSAWQIAVF